MPHSHYCVILNPVILDDKKEPVKDEYGQYKLRHADKEVRLTQVRFFFFFLFFFAWQFERLFTLDRTPSLCTPTRRCLPSRSR